MQRDTIKINGEAYQVGFSFYALKEFEELTGKSIEEAKGSWDNLMYFYSTLKGLNENFTMKLTDFIDYLDQHPDLLIQFQTPPQSPATPQPEALKKKNLFVFWMLLALLSVSPVLVPIISGIAWIWLSLVLVFRFIAKIGKKRGSRY